MTNKIRINRKMWWLFCGSSQRIENQPIRLKHPWQRSRAVPFLLHLYGVEQAFMHAVMPLLYLYGVEQAFMPAVMPLKEWALAPEVKQLAGNSNSETALVCFLAAIVQLVQKGVTILQILSRNPVPAGTDDSSPACFRGAQRALRNKCRVNE